MLKKKKVQENLKIRCDDWGDWKEKAEKIGIALEDKQNLKGKFNI